MVRIKGYEFKPIVVRDSYARRAIQYRNDIIENLKVFGVVEDDVTIHLEGVPIRKAPACSV